jgi:hypothetical protein
VVLSLDDLIEEVVLVGVRMLAAVVGAERKEAAGELVLILTFGLSAVYMFLFRIYSIPMGLSRVVVVMPSAGCSVVLY